MGWGRNSGGVEKRRQGAVEAVGNGPEQFGLGHRHLSIGNHAIGAGLQEALLEQGSQGGQPLQGAVELRWPPGRLGENLSGGLSQSLHPPGVGPFGLTGGCGPHPGQGREEAPGLLPHRGQGPETDPVGISRLLGKVMAQEGAQDILEQAQPPVQAAQGLHRFEKGHPLFLIELTKGRKGQFHQGETPGGAQGLDLRMELGGEAGQVVPLPLLKQSLPLPALPRVAPKEQGADHGLGSPGGVERGEDLRGDGGVEEGGVDPVGGGGVAHGGGEFSGGGPIGSLPAGQARSPGGGLAGGTASHLRWAMAQE